MGRSRAALVLGIPALLVLAFVVSLAFRSLGSRTRPKGLGPMPGGGLSPCPGSPNCVSSLAPPSDARHHVEPLRYRGASASAWQEIRWLVAKIPRTRIYRDERGYLHAECRSRLFRFTDDLELLLDAQKGVIHVRSASRVGYSDMGANRKRVEALRQAFQESGAPLPGADPLPPGPIGR